MVQNITYETAVRLIQCMNDRAPIPVDHDYKWFAFYAGKQVPDNTVYGRYSRNEDGILGIIARERVQVEAVEHLAQWQREQVAQEVEVISP